MALPRVILLALIAFSAPAVRSEQHREYQLRQFNAGQDAYYARGGGGNSGSTFKGTRCAEPSDDAIDNARVSCTYSGCRVRCLRGYRMEGSRSATMHCDKTSGQMKYLGQPWMTSLPPCLPYCGSSGCSAGLECVAPNKCDVPSNCPPGFKGEQCQDYECDPPCQNGGRCIFVDVCDCPTGYWGLLCEKHRCAVPARIPAHASYGSDPDLTALKVECDVGYEMKNRYYSESFICNHGQWILPDKRTIDDVDVACYAI